MQAIHPESSTMPHPALDAFWQSRIVYYPGFGSDGHPVRFFNTHHLANCFVYADYRMEEEQVCREMDDLGQGCNSDFRSYHSVERIRISAADLTPFGWRPHVPAPSSDWAKPRIRPYAFLERFERKAGLSDRQGAPSLSILFLGADGHASYDALFCQEDVQRTPYAVVLQDHGFGGNYDRFGRGGLMERIAITTGVFPEYLLVAENTSPWDGYVKVPGIDGSRGGMHHRMRHLYQRDPQVNLSRRSWQPDELDPHQRLDDLFYHSRN